MKRIIFSASTLLVLIAGAGACGRDRALTAVTRATLIDGTGRSPLSAATVIIAGDRIAEVGPANLIVIPRGARVIDATGKFLLPGLIDTHVHLELAGIADLGELPAAWSGPDGIAKLAAINARLDLLAGFTTVRDLGSTEAVLRLRDRIESGETPGPRIIASGFQLVKASPDARSDKMFLEYDGPGDAEEKVRRLAGLGADVIKIRLTRQRPVPSLDEVRAIVREAHRLRLRATVHTDVPADDLVELAIAAGADGIEHNAPLRSRDGQALKRMAQGGMSLMAGGGHFWLQRIDDSGLIDAFGPAPAKLFPADVFFALGSGMGVLHKQTGQMKESGWDPAQRRASFSQEMKQARVVGVLLVFGTDCGAYGMVHGEQGKALYGETRMGSSAMEAILMATRDAAMAVGREREIGTIEPGKLADMVLFEADPLADMRNLGRVFRVIKAGVIYDPATMIAP